MKQINERGACVQPPDDSLRRVAERRHQGRMMPKYCYDTYCGLYCGACDIMRAYRDGLRTGRSHGWDDLPERFTRHIRPAEIKCYGCKSDVVFDGCQDCAIRACARARGIKTNCLECREYPCDIHRRYMSMTQGDGQERKLPHWSVTVQNLKIIRSDGIAAWLADQKRCWKCPDCGRAFTWYQSSCAKCGRDLEPLKDFNK